LTKIFKSFGYTLQTFGRSIDKVGSAIQPKWSQFDEVSQHRRIVPIGGTAKLDSFVFIAPTATVVGKPAVGAHTAVWYGAVIRGDIHTVKVGSFVTIGEKSVITAGDQKHNTDVGDKVVIGIGSVIQGCKIGEGAHIGDGCIVLENCDIGEYCRIGSKSVVSEGTKIPPRQYWAGNPAFYIRELTPDEINEMQQSALENIRLAEKHDYWYSLTPEQRSVLILEVKERPTGGQIETFY